MKRRVAPDSHRELSELKPSLSLPKLSNLSILALFGVLAVLACGSSDAKHVVRREPTGGDATAGGDESTDGGMSASSGAGGTGGPVDQAGDSPGGDATSRGGAGDTGVGGTGVGGTGVGGAAGGGGTNACVNPEPLPKAPPNPSAGCSKQALSEVGTSQQPLMIADHRYYVKLPTAYDPTRPYPVVYAFHPAGYAGDWSERKMGYETNGAQDAAIRVYPTALSSSGWSAADLPFFAPLHEKITADYCVDRARAFAAGESPGGNFAITLGCEHGDQLRAIASCANNDGRPLSQCTGGPAVVLIHGKFDTQLGPGEGLRIRDTYATLNHCGSTTTPLTGYTDPLSNCVQYDCCDAGKPVYWCEHTDPEYAGTSHGWPAFAGDMTWEVFASF